MIGRRYLGVVTKKGSPEHDLQCACVRWFRLQYPHLTPLLFAVPNGGRRSLIEAKRMQMEGVTPGVSDLIFLSPSKGPVFIEMKTRTGRQSPEQKMWQKTVEMHGYHYFVIRDVDSFIDCIKAHIDEVTGVGVGSSTA